MGLLHSLSLLPFFSPFIFLIHLYTLWILPELCSLCIGFLCKYFYILLCLIGYHWLKLFWWMLCYENPFEKQKWCFWWNIWRFKREKAFFRHVPLQFMVSILHKPRQRMLKLVLPSKDHYEMLHCNRAFLVWLKTISSIHAPILWYFRCI